MKPPTVSVTVNKEVVLQRLNRIIAITLLFGISACVMIGYKMPGDKPLLVSLSRNPCYGTCPVYQIRIFTDGNFIYEGRQHAPLAGLFCGKLPGYEMKRLVKVLERANFVHLDNSYPSQDIVPADIPSIDISYYTGNNASKTIRDYNWNTPEPLKEAIRYVDSVALIYPLRLCK